MSQCVSATWCHLHIYKYICCIYAHVYQQITVIYTYTDVYIYICACVYQHLAVIKRLPVGGYKAADAAWIYSSHPLEHAWIYILIHLHKYTYICCISKLLSSSVFQWVAAILDMRSSSLVQFEVRDICVRRFCGGICVLRCSSSDMRFSSEMRKFESDIFSSFQGGLGYNFDFPFFVSACLCQCDSRVRLRVGWGSLAAFLCSFIFWEQDVCSTFLVTNLVKINDAKCVWRSLLCVEKKILPYTFVVEVTRLSQIVTTIWESEAAPCKRVFDTEREGLVPWFVKALKAFVLVL